MDFIGISSIDTLYFGLQIDFIDFDFFLEEIKNYLFFPLYPDYEKSRNRFYCKEMVNEEEGFYMFYEPHKNLKNDYVTIQLTGKFFRNQQHFEALNELFKIIGDYVRFQRIDCAYDICWYELPKEICYYTQTYGFPFPVYSEKWNNRKGEFMTYGRYTSDGDFYVNMVSCGKSDFRLRVYDKELDLLEKYKLTYCQYYNIYSREEFKKVYRIEYQCRGNGLKVLVDNLVTLGVDVGDLNSICRYILALLFNKYIFENIESPYEGIDIPVSYKKKSTLEGRIAYHRNKATRHYVKMEDLIAEKEQLEKENKQCKMFIKDKNVQKANDLKQFFDFDFQKFVENESFIDESKIGF